MPEGDTIYRAARTLDRALAGRIVTRFESVFPHLTRVHDDTPLTGRTVASVTSRGKHVLMAFTSAVRPEQALVLRTHMRMNGSWHIYRPGEAWQRNRRDMRIVVGTADFVAIAFNVPVAEWLTSRTLARHGELRSLGPDLLAADFDAGEAARRLRERAGVEVADALLNQRVMAGIGNVYKSEVLFACRVNPFARVQALVDEQVDCLVGTARRLLLANVTGGLAAMTTYTGFRKTTRRDDPSERLWVYGRVDEPCRRCGTPIRIAKQGRDARLTYWCPTCQA
jgi:endonuclease-8